MAKNLSAVWETWVRSLSWDDLPEKEQATHSSILAWRITWTEELSRTVHRFTKSWTPLMGEKPRLEKVKAT